MDEVLRANLSELVVYVTSLLQTGVGFVQEQAPIVIQQLLMYKIVTNWAGIVLIVGSFIALGIVAKKVHKYVFVDDGDEEALLVLCIVGIPLSVVLFITGCATVMTLIQLHFAPAIYLIEYLPRLL